MPNLVEELKRALKKMDVLFDTFENSPFSQDARKRRVEILKFKKEFLILYASLLDYIERSTRNHALLSSRRAKNIPSKKEVKIKKRRARVLKAVRLAKEISVTNFKEKFPDVSYRTVLRDLRFLSHKGVVELFRKDRVLRVRKNKR